MALALNTSHPLFGNIIAFVCPNGAGDGIVDLKVPSRVLTQTNGTFTHGTGAYGRHIASPDADNVYIECSPPIRAAENYANAEWSAMVVVNSTGKATGGGGNQPIYFKYNPVLCIDKTGGFLAASLTAGTAPAFVSDADVVANGAYSAVFNHSGASVGSGTDVIYHNGTLKGSLTISGGNTVTLDRLGTAQGFTRNTSQYVYWVFFDRLLTPTEISDLHTSLGADNTFSLLDAGGPTAYTIISDTVADTHTADTVTLTYTAAATAYTLTADSVSDSHAANDVTLTYNAAGAATITSEPLRDNTNTLLANQALDYVAIYDNTTGALVLRVTGVSTNASGIFTVSDAALTGGVTYKLDWKVTIQSAARMPAKAAV